MIVAEEDLLLCGPEADEAGSVSGKVQHLGGEAGEAEAISVRERLDALERPRHPLRVLEVDADVREHLPRRSEPLEIVGVELERVRAAPPPGDLRVVARMAVDGRAGFLLRRPRIAVMVNVTVRDEDAPDLAQRPPDLAESGEEGVAALFRTDPGVEKRDPAIRLLDDVDVRRSPGLDEGDRHGNARDAERREGHCSFFTASASSGSALKRSPTRP